MKKTYKTFYGENRNCLFKVGEELVTAAFTPTFSTDDISLQRAIEDSQSFNVGKLQLVTPPMQWIKIDRDENGFATEECLDRITELQKQGIDILLIVQIRGCSFYYALDARFFNQTQIKMIREEMFYTHYLPIPILKLEA